MTLSVCNAMIYGCVKLGKNVVIGDNTVIGKDGFGYKDYKRIPHYGIVDIGDYVDIGANCTIDRGQDRDTIIGEYTKIDNLVHIAHQDVIGKRNIIVAGTIFGGSVTTGDYNFFGLNSTIKNGVTIGNHCLIGAGAVVLKDIPDNKVVVGNPARILRDNYLNRLNSDQYKPIPRISP